MTWRTLTRTVVNRAWMAGYAREHARFRAALGSVSIIQRQYLLDLIRRNEPTAFGRKHRFARIHSVEAFQDQVPLTDYEGQKDAIEAIARGDPAVLTAEPVPLFQPTSGSQSATKFIPYTASLKREFQRGIAPWLYSLYHRKPALMPGSAYWSISPPVAQARNHGQLRVGFEQDADYLGGLGRRLFSVVSAVPPEVATCLDTEQFKTQALAWLLAEEDLRLISVWSPTFLTVLLEDLSKKGERILSAIEQFGTKRARCRARFLRQLLFQPGQKPDSGQIWPQLQVISCWTHGPSELYAKALASDFPHVEIQGKGLVATEAFVSLPFLGDSDPVLAVNSHFFEFEEQATKRILQAHELTAGSIYQVIVTTGGGFYRYRLGDLVRVTGHIKEAPCLRFVGREGNVSDLFGEKLNGTFAADVIQRALLKTWVNASFFLLAPVLDAGKTSYTLFLAADKVPDAAALKGLLEEGLCENFHYAHCRRLGQLADAKVFLIDQTKCSAAETYERTLHSRGIKLGDVKMMPLDAQFGWEQCFKGSPLA